MSSMKQLWYRYRIHLIPFITTGKFFVKLEFVRMGFRFHGNTLSHTTSSLSHNLVPQMGSALQLQSQSTSRQSNDRIAIRGRTSCWGKCSSRTSASTSLLQLASTSPH